jgi:hypothetical protein
LVEPATEYDAVDGAGLLHGGQFAESGGVLRGGRSQGQLARRLFRCGVASIVGVERIVVSGRCRGEGGSPWLADSRRTKWGVFYAAIEGDFIQTTNTDLIAATRLGAVVLAVDSADGSLRKQWILDEKVNRNGTLCLSDEAG